MNRSVFLVLIWLFLVAAGCSSNSTDPVADVSFSWEGFSTPESVYGPWVRWWWPGNDVEKAELERELKLFAEVGMAGVEIQPFTMGLKFDAPDAVKARVNSWDEEAFYDNLRFVLRAALEADLVVDLNSGSGWPTLSGCNRIPSR